MFPLLIFGLIAFALVQRRRYHHLWGGRPCQGYSFSHWHADRYRRRADKADLHAARFERRAKVQPMDEERQQFSSEAERKAYRRARRQAAREAGFYGHLMVYATTIGFLFLINMLVSPRYFWFLFPAIGWGFGLASHFMAVYGWRFIRQRVFDPAIARELQREKEVLRTEKQASLDELAATFAHEIRNPITAAKSLVQQMGEDPTSRENIEYAKVALDELARVERSVSHLLRYAKEEDFHFADANAATVLDSALTQMRSRLEGCGVAVARSYLGGPIIRADADKLRQVFSNIIDNAIDAIAAAGSKGRLELAIDTRKAAGLATFRFTDNGCGIAPDNLGRIFNPFYTSKPSGTGLGMAVARKIIEAHRGEIRVHSQVGYGACFEVDIPLAQAAADDEVSQAGRDRRTASAQGLHQ